MPWETKFNIEETLEKALMAFWEYGYNATSMRDLTRCMGINSGSIYSTFGNKRTLFLSALRHYNTISANQLQKFEKMSSSKKGIISFFEHIRNMTLSGCDTNGCFVLNTTLEMAPHDKEMCDIVSRGQDIMKDFFKRLIKRGQINGEINKSISAADTSELLLSLLLGVRVLTRNKATKKQFNVVIKNIDLILAS